MPPQWRPRLGTSLPATCGPAGNSAWRRPLVRRDLRRWLLGSGHRISGRATHEGPQGRNCSSDTWGSGPPQNATELVAEAERLGYDSVWTAEAYGSDALTPLAWWGSRTERVRLGTALCQLSARTPTAMGMAAITLDHLSGGRFVLGLGVSGPQVVEGWYGQSFEKPLARTREYVDIVRQVVARADVVTNDGPNYPLPYPGGTGLGKPLKAITHPLRTEIPIVMGAEGPKNIALAAEIADGWFPSSSPPAPSTPTSPTSTRGSPAPGPGARPRTSRCSPSRRRSWPTTSSPPPP